MALGGYSVSYIAFTVLHFCQFVMAITVCALYGVELDRARKAHVDGNPRWVCSRFHMQPEQVSFRLTKMVYLDLR